RMPIFYIVAGFFSFMSFTKYGYSKYVTSRLSRLAIPLFAIGIPLNTALYFFVKERFHLPHYSHYLNGGWLVHLWFLPNLFVYSIALPIIYRVLEKSKSTNILLVTCICMSSCFICARIGWRAANHGIIFSLIDIGKLIYYLPWFAFGAWLYVAKDQL